MKRKSSQQRSKKDFRREVLLELFADIIEEVEKRDVCLSDYMGKYGLIDDNLRDWGTTATCTNSAQYIAHFLRKRAGLKAEVWGYSAHDNPEALVGRGSGGHDFCLVEERYIVDYWLPRFGMAGSIESDEGGEVLDISLHPDRAKKLYGDPEKWKLMDPPDVNSSPVFDSDEIQTISEMPENAKCQLPGTS